MSDVLALNFDGVSSPSIRLKLQGHSQHRHRLGWGFGWYPHDQQAAAVTKDPSAHDTMIATESLADWASFRSTTFLCKSMGAAEGYTHHETQPFSRSFAGRDWLFMHNGDLDKVELDKLHKTKSRFLEPMGTTDSELAFCYLLGLLRTSDARQLSDIKPQKLLKWLQQLDPLGSADIIITDGVSLLCYQGTQPNKAFGYALSKPPHVATAFNSDMAQLDLNDPRDGYRSMLAISTTPFDGLVWNQLQPGQMILARRGHIMWDSTLHTGPDKNSNGHEQKKPKPSRKHESVTNIRSITHTADGEPLHYRLFEFTHTTRYTYDAPVEHSTHVFRLEPEEDHIQEVEHAKLSISMDGEEIQYEDVFGNHSIYYSINAPYTELNIESTARVKIFARPPDDHSLSRRRTNIPLVWMPWQQQMMMAYLLPPELPESQLVQLTEYAHSFVERNDSRLLATLEDINNTIYRDYVYTPGATSLNTTPFEVYANRKGVCQDFANLFICLARLLSIPARYRMGYIYTGADYANKIQSEASHAWVEVYLPYIGWRGFDPTNGCTVAQDHIRVACGRNYIDATPTSGTIYKGGGGEVLNVDVKIKEIFADGEQQ